MADGGENQWERTVPVVNRVLSEPPLFFYHYSIDPDNSSGWVYAEEFKINSHDSRVSFDKSDLFEYLIDSRALLSIVPSHEQSGYDYVMNLRANHVM